MFYKSCIQSVLTFSFICWFGNVSQKDKNSLQRIVNISSKVTGVTQSTLTALYEKQVVNKATRILANDKHVFCPRLEGLELSLVKQIGSGSHLFLCRSGF